jgi:8-oxo-dGTP pyrophosphatase MutT (NUDIX family)
MPISDYLRNLRTRIGHDMVLMPGVVGIVINAAGEILVERTKDSGDWWLPGGAVDPGEEPAAAIAREVWEETGVRVVPERVVATYADPLSLYPNGDQVLYVSIAFLCRPVGGEAHVHDEESLEVSYFALGDLPPLERHDRLRLEQALRDNPQAHFLLNGKSEGWMPTPDYIRDLRSKIGHDLLLLPGVTAIVINAAGEILLQRRSDNGQWGLLSGIMDPGEEPADTVIREVREESGLDVIPERVSGVYSGEDYHVRYPNGDESIYVDIAFVCRPVAGEPHIGDDESLEIRYFAPDALPAMHPVHYYRIEHALRNDPRAYFRFDRRR